MPAKIYNFDFKSLERKVAAHEMSRGVLVCICQDCLSANRNGYLLLTSYTLTNTKCDRCGRDSDLAIVKRKEEGAN